MSVLVESVFRRESARCSAWLVARLGAANVELALDAVQEAFVRALWSWPIHGEPERPAAWIRRVAYRWAIDRLRRDGRLAPWQDGDEPAAAPDSLEDEELTLLALCAHPGLASASQVALILRALCGLSVREIAAGFMSGEEAVQRRLARARAHLSEFGLGSDRLTPERLGSALQAIYLGFNEGYLASGGDGLLRKDLIDQALLLTERLAATREGDTPATHALRALMWLHSSRLDARVGADGRPVRLDRQDRTLWDRARIAHGLQALARSAEGPMSVYHPQAAIAAEHAVAPSFGATNWARVLQHYDDLLALQPSDVARCSRAVALGFLEGPQAALDALDACAGLDRYAYAWSARARFLGEIGRRQEAGVALARAAELAPNAAERSALEELLA